MDRAAGPFRSATASAKPYAAIFGCVPATRMRARPRCGVDPLDKPDSGSCSTGAPPPPELAMSTVPQGPPGPRGAGRDRPGHVDTDALPHAIYDEDTGVASSEPSWRKPVAPLPDELVDAPVVDAY